MEYNRDSIHALGVLDHRDKEERNALEAAFNRWIYSMEEGKWARGLQWFENASYLSGNHLTRYFYSADGGFGFQTYGIDRQSQFDNLVAKEADNRLIRPVESVMSLLTNTRPQPRVTPNSDRPEDRDAAALGQITLDLLFEKPLELPSKLREIAAWICICGTAAIEIKYGETDIPVEIPKIKTKEVANPLFGEVDDEPETIQREEVSGTDIEWRRDINARVWSAYHLTPDPGATSPEDMSWIMRSSFEDLDQVKEKFDRKEEGFFPEHLGALVSDNASKYILYWWAKIRDILDSPQYYQHGGGLSPVTFYSHGGYAPNQVMLSVVDVKPTMKFPRGRYLVFAGGRLIYAGDGRCYVEDPAAPGRPKYPERWHPYSFFYWFKVPGRFWGIPLLSEIVPLQKKINAIDVLSMSNRQYSSIGQWLVPKHSKIREGHPSGIPGEIYEYTDVGRAKPEKVQNVPLPAEFFVERNDLIEGIDVISGAGAIQAEIASSAARSGPVLDFLRQEKLRSKSAMLQAFEQSLEQVGQNILIEIQANMTEEDPDLTRRVQVAAREHSQLTVQTFVGQSLRDHHAVKLDIASELMHAPEAMEQKALEFMQAAQGNLTPQERSAVYRALRLDEFQRNEESASVMRAERMIARITSGMVEAAFPMRGIDNATVMAPVFRDELLSDRFLDYDEKVRNALLNLFEIYSQFAAEEQAQAMQMQMMMMQGGGAQANGAAGPPAPAGG